jgi:hypothetical protein
MYVRKWIRPFSLLLFVKMKITAFVSVDNFYVSFPKRIIFELGTNNVQLIITHGFKYVVFLAHVQKKGR